MDALLPDTFADSVASALVLDAMRFRDGSTEGLESYEGTVTNRVWVGVKPGGRASLRERTLYHRETLAQVRWRLEGGEIVRELYGRSTSPVAGDGFETGQGLFGFGFDVPEMLDLDDFGDIEPFDPEGDRIDFFDAGFIQPVSETGLRSYRFRSGDTLTIHFPAPTPTLTLVEVQVEPREDAWEAVEGSIWFDAASRQLVRGVYRPSDFYDHAVQEPGDLDDVPGFVKPMFGTPEYVVLDYGLYEQRWWLPRRLLAAGTVDWGFGFTEMPFQIEWTLRDVVVNEAESPLIAEVEAFLGASGGRRGRARDLHVDMPIEDLEAAGFDVPAPLHPDGESTFDPIELEPLLGRLDEVAGEPPPLPEPTVLREFLSGLRYNRVQSLSAGFRRVVPLGASTRGTARARWGMGDEVPDTDIMISNGPWRWEVYHRLRDAMAVDAGWSSGSASGLGNSVSTLLFGQDDGNYFRSTGSALGRDFGGETPWARVSLFFERHRAVEKETDFALSHPGEGGDLRRTLDVERADMIGVRLDAVRQWGFDPEVGVTNLRVHGEIAGGDEEYLRTLVTFGHVAPLPFGLAGGIEVSGGWASEATPIQRTFFVGGTEDLRAFQGATAFGNALWSVRTEVANSVAGLRAVLFTDLGWAGPSEEWFSDDLFASVGTGLSFLDGLMRLDLARGVSRGNDWRVHFYTGGIF